MKLCMYIINGTGIHFERITAFRTFEQYSALYSIEIVYSTTPTIFSGYFSNFANILRIYCKCICGILMELEFLLNELESFKVVICG